MQKGIILEVPYMATYNNDHPESKNNFKKYDLLQQNLDSKRTDYHIIKSVLEMRKNEPCQYVEYKRTCATIVYESKDIKVIRWLKSPEFPNIPIRSGPTVPTWYAVISPNLAIGQDPTRHLVRDSAVTKSYQKDLAESRVYLWPLGSSCFKDDNNPIVGNPFQDNKPRGFESSEPLKLLEERIFCKFGVEVFKNHVGPFVSCKSVPINKNCDICANEDLVENIIWSCCSYSGACMVCASKLSRCPICKSKDYNLMLTW